MHAKGIMHRDLKFGNIFLNKNLRIKIGDFGLAQKLEKGQRRSSFCGTENFMAPEVIQNKRGRKNIS